MRFLYSLILLMISSLTMGQFHRDKVLKISDSSYDIFDEHTGAYVNFFRVVTYADNSPMTDAKCDGILYRKINNIYVKRNFSEEINVKWFGAKGDAIHDDTQAIQRALNSLDAPATVYFPKGFYKITSTLKIPTDKPIKIKGGGMYNTRIYYGSEVKTSSIFQMESADTFQMESLSLLGNNKAECGFKCEAIIHSYFKDVLISYTTGSALRLNNGYSNTIEDCYIYTNLGNGINITGGANHNLNISRNKIYDNKGFGIIVANGFNVNIYGNGLELNNSGAIASWDIKGLNIRDNYFERNGITGQRYFLLGSIVKSDIHILSKGYSFQNGPSLSVDVCNITGNHFTPYKTGELGIGIDAPVFLTVADKVNISNNQLLDVSKVKYMVAMPNAKSVINSFFVLEQNTLNTFGLIGEIKDYQPIKSLHLLSNNYQTVVNYLPKGMINESASEKSIQITKSSANFFPDTEAYELSGEESIDFWTYKIDMENYPQLRGKLVWFGLYYTNTGSENGVSLKIDNIINNNLSSNGEFNNLKFKSVSSYVSATSRQLVIGFKKIGKSPKSVIISKPILTIAGNSINKF